MRIGANFEMLLQAIPPELLAQVHELYRQEAAMDGAACEVERAEIGRINHDTSVVHEGVGALTTRLHATDYWAQQVIHRAPNDPDLWRWFKKTPEGQYARVAQAKPARIVVPAWRDGLWSTVAGSIAQPATP